MRSVMVAAAISLALLSACTGSRAQSGRHPSAADLNTTDPQDYPTVARGRYLAIVADCAACHTQPGSGKELAGGRAIQTPFGSILAPNITPDEQTGIGAWSDNEFVNALLNGTGHDGEHLYPAMPYTYLTHMSRNDALAIRAWLNTIPPVRNKVVSDQLPFPFSIRASMIAWNWLFFTPGRFRPDPRKSADWNRGAYLVEGPMHCGMCHTPKNLLGGDETGRYLHGYSLQGWFAPNITNSNYRGLGSWDVNAIATYLKTGHNQYADASGPMGEEVADSSSKMTDADLRDVALYLKDQNVTESKPAPIAMTDPQMKMGGAIYADECSACHTPTGSGIAGLFPTLSNAPAVESREATSAIHVVLVGTRSVGTQGAPTAAAMPPFAWLLTDRQVAAVVTYIRNSWGNAAPRIDAGDVSSERGALVPGG
jgi:mono/diheme cytochrome c family protein